MLKDRNIFDDNFCLVLEVISERRIVESPSSVDEKLIRFLLVHDQVLSTNDAEIFFVLAGSKSNNLIGFSCFRLEKGNRELAHFLKRETIIHHNLIDLGTQEDIHALKL